MVTDYILEYFDQGNIQFKIYAYPEFSANKTIDRTKTDPRQGAKPKQPEKGK